MRNYIILIVIFSFFLDSTFSLDLNSSAYLTFRDSPRKSGISLDARELKWLNQVFGLMKKSDFTFIFRKDKNHWIGLYRENAVMSVQMHDETAGFDARSVIDLKTGALMLEKGVLYKGLNEQDSLVMTAKELKAYLGRVLDDKGVFGKANGPVMTETTKPVMTEAAKPMMETEKQMDKESPVAHDAKSHAPSVVSEWKTDQMRFLKEGNSRFVSGKLLNTDRDSKKRQELSKGQKPFSIIVSCSDSRTGPEVIFDQGLGSLFVVRTAGEVVDEHAIGSIEYAAEHLGSRHILVLAHSECGAVKAAVSGGNFSENISSIVEFIEPSVEKAKESHNSNVLDESIRENAREVVRHIMKSEVIHELMLQGLVIDIGIYDLDTGKVSRIEY